MADKKAVRGKIEKLVKEFFASPGKKFIPGKTKVPLSIPSFDWREINGAIDSLLSTSVTMGKKVFKFEEMWAKYLGVKHAVMVNSGSSANLIALSVLSNPVLKKRIKPGDEIIVPAVAWSTTFFPILNIGAIPVLVDVNLEDFNINIASLKKAITRKTKAIMAVHLLGNPANMTEVMKIARKHNLFVIEDTCESHGAKHQGRKTGSFGDVGTFSFFFSHHISTIEGGMVVTNSDYLADLARVIRAHGWVREMKEGERMAKKYPKIDKRFLFVNMGYNLRPTEIQGAFGIHQLKKLENFIKIRQENSKYWTERLSAFSEYLFLPEIEDKPGERRVWFGYPVFIKPGAPFERKELVDFLEKKNIETRPIMAGNFAEQPAIKLFKHKVSGKLANSEAIMSQAFFFGNHQGIGKKERKYIADCLNEFFKKYVQ